MPENDQFETFSKLLITNQPRIYGFIYTLVQNRSATDEILQEVSSVLWKKFDQFQPGTDFGAWAMKVARFSVFEWRRKQAKLPLPIDDDLLQALVEKAIEVSCESEADLEALDTCVTKLSDHDQQLIRLRYFDESSVANIAATEGKSRVAIYKVLSRIHRDLLDCIETTKQALA